jgi:hypothetical protein
MRKSTRQALLRRILATCLFFAGFYPLLLAGFLAADSSLDRNRLKGVVGDQINAILSAAGMNFKKLLRWLGESLQLIYCWLLTIQQAVKGGVVA